MADDKRLARHIQQGDRQAFAEFVDAYGARVHRLVRRYTHREADAEDLTQEIFLDLYRGIGSFRGEATLATWVYRVALNHCRKRCERTRPPDLPLDAAQWEPEDARADPALCAQRRELSDRLHGALDDLSPPHREVVILHELHGLTYAECAAALGVPVGTVKSRLSHAFRRLRSSLGGYVLGESPPLCPDIVGETSP